jgi:hypothetical protein
MRQSLPVPILLEAALSQLAEDVARQVFEALAEATRPTALPAP